MRGYVCAATGITEFELFRFADLQIDGLLKGAARDGALEDLRAYGHNEVKVTRYMTLHLEQCGACRGLYESEMGLSHVLREARPAKGTPRES